MTPALLLLVKASVLLAAALAAAGLFRRRTPALTRHRIWSSVFAAVLMLPALTMLLPAINVPVPSVAVPARFVSVQRMTTPVPAPKPASSEAGKIAGPEEEEEQAGLPASTPSAPSLLWSQELRLSLASVPLSMVALSVWAIGTAAGLLAVAISLVRVRGLARRATPVTDPAWLDAAALVADRVGVRHVPRVLESWAVASPMAGGVWRPTVFLPASFREWTAERRDVVLAHEIVHLAAHDPLRHVVARLAMSLYWFHPLAWMAARRSAIAREQACDETVLALGTRPSAYARVLLELAEAAGPSVVTLGALPMAQRSHLETRLMAILNDHARPAAAPKLRVPAVALIALTFAVAAARPAASVTGSLEHPRAEVRVVSMSGVVAPDLQAGPDLRQAQVAATPESGEGPAHAASAQTSPNTSRDSVCASEAIDSRYFQGTISSSDRGGRTQIDRQVGRRGADRVIQWTFGDIRICMLAEGAGDRDDLPSKTIGSARRVSLEARSANHVQRLDVGSDGRSIWTVDGKDRAIDGPARDWRERMLALLDTTWELSSLRGQVSSLRGEISSIRGQESGLRGQISSLQGEVSSMRGRISSAQGEESSLRGQISAIRGHESSLRGQISSEEGAISSLNADRYGATSTDRAQIAERIREHQKNIIRIEAEIRAYGADKRVENVERDIAAFNAGRKADNIEKDIQAFDLSGKVAAINAQIKTLDVSGKTGAIERRIQALEADRRSADLESRLDAAAKRLADAVAAIR